MRPRTIIRNKTNSDIFLGWVPPNGVNVPANGSVVIDGNIVAEIASRQNKVAQQHFNSLLQRIDSNQLDVVVVPGATVSVVSTNANSYSVALANGVPQLVVVDATGGNKTVTLPAPRAGIVVHVASQLAGTNTVTVNVGDTTNHRILRKDGSLGTSLTLNNTAASVTLVGISDSIYAAL